MDDQIGKRVEDLQRELAEFRREMNDLLARSFRWTIATLAVAVLATWFGVFIIVKGGGAVIRQLLLR